MIKLIIVAFLGFILYHLAAGCWYMLTDRSGGTRVVKALSWRIGLSIALFALIGAGIATGLIQPNEGIRVGAPATVQPPTVAPGAP
jgi:succinate dehydrogenase hydrophobic anchor subunit